MSCALTPAWWVDVGGVGIHPEVVAVRVAVKMEPEPVTTDLIMTQYIRGIKAGWRHWADLLHAEQSVSEQQFLIQNNQPGH